MPSLLRNNILYGSPDIQMFTDWQQSMDTVGWAWKRQGALAALSTSFPRFSPFGSSQQHPVSLERVPLPEGSVRLWLPPTKLPFLFSALYPSTVPRRIPTRLTLPPSSSPWGTSSGSSLAPSPWAPRMRLSQH